MLIEHVYGWRLFGCSRLAIHHAGGEDESVQTCSALSPCVRMRYAATKATDRDRPSLQWTRAAPSARTRAWATEAGASAPSPFLGAHRASPVSAGGTTALALPLQAERTLSRKATAAPACRSRLSVPESSSGSRSYSSSARSCDKHGERRLAPASKLAARHPTHQAADRNPAVSARRSTKYLAAATAASHLLEEVGDATLRAWRRGVEHISNVESAEQRAISSGGLPRHVQPREDAHGANAISGQQCHL